MGLTVYSDDIPGKHSNKGLKNTTFLGMEHVLRTMLMQDFIDFNYFSGNYNVMSLRDKV
jgi:hypothetical protein